MKQDFCDTMKIFLRRKYFFLWIWFFISPTENRFLFLLNPSNSQKMTKHSKLTTSGFAKDLLLLMPIKIAHKFYENLNLNSAKYHNSTCCFKKEFIISLVWPVKNWNNKISTFRFISIFRTVVKNVYRYLGQTAQRQYINQLYRELG